MKMFRSTFSTTPGLSPSVRRVFSTALRANETIAERMRKGKVHAPSRMHSVERIHSLDRFTFCHMEIVFSKMLSKCSMKT